MKKLLMIAAVIMTVASAQASDMFSTPRSNVEQQASINYGGVKYASSAFSADITTVAFSTTTYPSDLGYVFYGVHFTTGVCGNVDFVDVYDSTGANAAQFLRVPTFRIYNVYGSTTVGTPGGSTCSGFSGVFGQNPVPVRIKNKLFFKPNSVNYNSIMLLYYKDE